MKNKKFEVLPINIDKIKEEDDYHSTKESFNAATIKIMMEVNGDVSEKLKDYAYWMRMTQTEVLLMAFEQFIEKNPVESRPESEKMKSKVGRKKMNSSLRFSNP